MAETDDGVSFPQPYGDARRAELARLVRAGDEPTVPLSYADLRAAAERALDGPAAAYVGATAGDGETARANQRAFDRWRIRPRVLRDVADRDLRVALFGQQFPAPLLLAPVAMLSLFDDAAERAVACAAASLGVPQVVSSGSTASLEDVAETLGETPKWFQLYWGTDRAVAESFVDRAVDAGYDAIVLTVDVPTTGWRPRQFGDVPLPWYDGEGVGNYLTDPAFRARLDQPPETNVDATVDELLSVFSDASHTWREFDALREHVDVPLVVKGVLHPQDARHAVDHGADAVVVSNHGGRQIDGELGSLTALPGLVDAVGDDVPVLFDSGVRSGADAFRALALGADAVLLGRPYVYGLALAGEEGVRAVCKNVLAELDLTTALAGYDSVAAVDREALVERPR